MCDTFTALATQTARGRALFAKNSDRERNEAQALELHPPVSRGGRVRATYIEIPDVERTHAILISRPCWMWGAEMGANAHGVVIGNEALHSRIKAPRRRALTGMDLLRLALERAVTAAEAADVIISLLERHGQGGDCGHLGRFYYHNGFIIADHRQAFVLETVGRDWVLQEVRSVRALSNAYSIGADFDRIRPTLLAQLGGGRPDVAASLIDEARDAVSFGRGRCARGQALLEAEAPNLNLAGMAAILRDHGAQPDWTPANTARRTICMHAAEGPRRSQSVASMLSELAADDAVHWVTGTSAPCLSILKPMTFATGLPDHGPTPADHFDAASLWWRHEQTHRAALADHAAAHALIAPERDALEAAFRARIDAADGPEALSAAVRACWAKAEAAEARWRAALAIGPRPRPTNPPAYGRSWARLSQVAGMPPLNPPPRARGKSA